MNLKTLNNRIAALETQPDRITDWERRKRDCAEHSMRQTITDYGHVIHGIEHSGEPYTDESRAELLGFADEVDSQPQHAIEDTLKEYNGIMRQIEAEDACHSHIK